MSCSVVWQYDRWKGSRRIGHLVSLGPHAGGVVLLWSADIDHGSYRSCRRCLVFHVEGKGAGARRFLSRDGNKLTERSQRSYSRCQKRTWGWILARSRGGDRLHRRRGCGHQHGQSSRAADNCLVIPGTRVIDDSVEASDMTVVDEVVLVVVVEHTLMRV